ncbi:MAG: NUDIX hydrolase [Propionibacteriaceae bacterium]
MTEAVVSVAQALAAGTLGASLAAARPAQGSRSSAVLVLLTVDSVLLLRRSEQLRHHGGQVAFPGGAADPDETPVETALRETWEETGIDPTQVRVLGQMPATHIPVSSFDVTPVVAWWTQPTLGLRGNPTEVAAIELVFLAELAAPENRFTAIHEPSGFTTPGFKVNQLWIWGFTGFVLDEILQAAGVTEPWDITDIRPVPAKFLAGKN